MKRMLSIIAAFTLIFGFSVKVFAALPSTIPDDDGPFFDTVTVEIHKMLDVKNPDTINPAETFNFLIGTGTGLRDGAPITTVPQFTDTDFTIDVSQAGTTGVATITLPAFTQVGVYTYPVTETAGDTAGMVYDGKTYYLVITVVNNPEFGEEEEPEFLRVLTFLDPGLDVKTDEITNEFYAGDLTVNKVITGNFADPDDVFTITVTVTPDPEKDIEMGPIVWGTTDVSTDEEGVITAVYKLKGGQSFTIENLPYDVSYTVVETQFPDYDLPGYDSEATGDMDSAAISTTIINNRDTTVDTGISLDSLPYILLLGFAVLGMGVLFFRKRQNANF